MNAQDIELLNMVSANKDKYILEVDNDVIHIIDIENDILVNSLQYDGQSFAVAFLRYSGYQAEWA